MSHSRRPARSPTRTALAQPSITSSQALSQRLKALQVPGSPRIDPDLQKLTGQCDPLRQETPGQDIHPGVEPRSTVTWICQHYGKSHNPMRRRFLRFVQLKVQKGRNSGPDHSDRGVLQGQAHASSPTTPGPSQDQGKGQGGHFHQRVGRLRVGGGGGRVVGRIYGEPIQETDGYPTTQMVDPPMSPEGVQADVTALQNKMLGLEHALSRVIQHLEQTTPPGAPLRIMLPSNTANLEQYEHRQTVFFMRSVGLNHP